MMGYQSGVQNKCIYTAINIDERVRKNHILRRISEIIDFDFIYDEVKNTYGSRGNVSVPPPVILKLMFLLIFYNVRSERELIQTVPERLDWLWFLNYSFDDDIPDHSVLSKARKRWGPDLFEKFFNLILIQCVDAGIVDGEKVFTDASLVRADASNNSVVNQEKISRYLKKGYREFEKRLEDASTESPVVKNGVENQKHISMTDPDASITRMGKGNPKLNYKIHRVVDEKAEVITATDVTTGSVNEAHLMTALVDKHEINTGEKAKIVVADSKYGTIENYLACHDKEIKAHMESVEKKHGRTGTKAGVFPPEEFTYDSEDDVYLCPAGEQLRRRSFYKKRNHFEYAAPANVCNQCKLKSQCTQSKSGRTVKRHLRQDDLEQMLIQKEQSEAKKDITKRQHLMERSFARSTRYGFKRARWRRLWNVKIQEYLIAGIQNLMILIKNTTRSKVSGTKQLYNRIGHSLKRNGLLGPFYPNFKIFIFAGRFKYVENIFHDLNCFQSA